MPTATLNQPASKTIPPARAILRRFAWKEYRTLRSFWLAVLIVGLLIQWLSGVLLTPATDFPALRLYVALAAATLYAAGAAAILFAVEHEDGTYDFLSGLPTTWLPLFAGKLLLATASAIALAATLTFTGWMAALEFKAPSGYNTSLTLGIFGIAIFEAIAWGTLFSLLFKRPLAAAIMTLVLGALATHIAVNLSAANTSSTASLDPQAYVNAIPLRLAIVVAVLACCVLAARRWLRSPVLFPSPLLGGARGGGFLPDKDWFKNPYGLTTILFATRNFFHPLYARLASKANQGRRTTMLARLLWQSWRESWKLLPVPLLVAGLLLLGISAVLSLAASADVAATLIAATTFFAPALYGALAFSADQRRGQVRFLAEHAAAPHYVWLARHIVWLGTLIALLVVLAIALAISVLLGLQFTSQRVMEYRSGWSNQPSYFIAQDIYHTVTSILVGGPLACFGALTAYAIGQLCSMTLRSEILAAFLALVLSVALSAWVAVLVVWNLSGWLFLFPLATGLLLATWLRAPAWIAGRNTWRAWLKPALACVAPLLLIGLLLPQQRLAQIRDGARFNKEERVRLAEAKASATQSIQSGPEAEETAQMYLKAADMLHAPLTDDPLAPWSGPEYAGSDADGLPGGIDEFKIPRDHTNAYAAAKQKAIALEKEQHAAAIKLAIEASQRPTCQFKFNLSPAKLEPDNRRNNLRLEPDKTYEGLDELLTALTSPTLDDEIMLEQFLAGLRMSGHLRSGQPTPIFIRQLKTEQDILKRIGEWAASDDRTNDERREAIEKLQAYLETERNPSQALWADQALVQDVIAGKELPLVLAEQPVSTATYLAFLANELPWERERALAALDIITDQNVYESHELSNWLQRSSPNNMGSFNLRRWLQPGSDFQDRALRDQAQVASTSYLARFEYDARVPIHELFREYLDTETWQRAVLIKIALAMYHNDHGEYPESLSALVPEYLGHELLDPYSMQPFGYAPAGLDAPLTQLAILEGHELPPHTPFLWSVGPFNAHLTRSEQGVQPWDEDHPDAERIQELKPSYYLLEEYPWYAHGWTDLVFPLPK